MKISLIVFFTIFVITISYLYSNYFKWNHLPTIKSKLSKNGIIITFILGVIFYIVFMIIGKFATLDDGTPLYVIAMLGGSLLLIVSSLASRKGVYVDKNLLVKIGIFGKETIALNSIRRIEKGYYTKVISKNKTISFETKFYDENFAFVIETINDKNVKSYLKCSKK